MDPVEVPLYEYGRNPEPVDHALVSPIDGHLTRWTWKRDEDGYARRDTSVREHPDESPKGVTVLMHRQIAGLDVGDPLEVHHVNENRLDNRRHNLVICTHEMNAKAQARGSRALLEHWGAANPELAEAGYVPVGDARRTFALAKGLVLREGVPVVAERVVEAFEDA